MKKECVGGKVIPYSPCRTAYDFYEVFSGIKSLAQHLEYASGPTAFAGYWLIMMNTTPCVGTLPDTLLELMTRGA